jgi:hypothetical protein
MKDIPFKKDNMFCFDNESFLYLVALQDKWQSIKNAQFQIVHIICRILETIKNTLRSIIVYAISNLQINQLNYVQYLFIV